MKKAILIGAILLGTSGAILIANNNSNTTNEPCCNEAKCEQGICKPTAACPNPDECCRK